MFGFNRRVLLKGIAAAASAVVSRSLKAAFGEDAAVLPASSDLAPAATGAPALSAAEGTAGLLRAISAPPFSWVEEADIIVLLRHNPELARLLPLDLLMDHLHAAIGGYASKEGRRLRPLHTKADPLAFYCDFLVNCGFLVDVIDERFRLLSQEPEACKLLQENMLLSFRDQLEVLQRMLRPLQTVENIGSHLLLGEGMHRALQRGKELVEQGQAAFAETPPSITTLPPASEINDLISYLWRKIGQNKWMPEPIRNHFDGLYFHKGDRLTEAHAQKATLWHAVESAAGDGLEALKNIYFFFPQGRAPLTGMPHFFPDSQEPISYLDCANLNCGDALVRLRPGEPYVFSGDYIRQFAHHIVTQHPELRREEVAQRLEEAYRHGLKRQNPISTFMPPHYVEDDALNLQLLRIAEKERAATTRRYHFPGLV